MKLPILITGCAAVLTTATLAAPPAPGDGCKSQKSWAMAEAPGGKTIVETAVAAGSFETLAAALGAADLVEALQGEGPFTVFAPTDEAFAKLPAATLKELLKPENKDQLTNILTFHVVAGEVSAERVVKMKSATALNGQRIAIEAGDAGVSVAGVNVVKTDIHCSNGIIHVVDTVMMPAMADIVETAVAAGSFETLAAALQAGGLVEALQGEGPFTVFAPTDAAFAALPEGTLESLLKPENKAKLVSILKFHVVPGRIYSDQLENGQRAGTLLGQKLAVRIDGYGVTVGGGKVEVADIETTNGVIHVVDRVLLPE